MKPVLVVGFTTYLKMPNYITDGISARCAEEKEVIYIRDYQAKKDNKYYLPDTVYRRVLALVRDYPRMCAMRDGIFHESPDNTSGIRGSGTGDPTAQKAMKLMYVDDALTAIDKALDGIPVYYRQGILDNIIFGKRIIDLPNASQRTWSRYKAKFLYKVAKFSHIPF